jgi:Domain of unknown function (DUF4352)
VVEMKKLLTAILLLAVLGTSLALGSDNPYILIKKMDNCQGTEFSEIGSSRPADGNVFLVVGLLIENHGYDSISIEPSSFSAFVNGFGYRNSPATYYLDKVGKKILPSGNLNNGASIDGYVAFEIPTGSKDYNVTYTGWEDVKPIYQCI